MKEKGGIRWAGREEEGDACYVEARPESGFIWKQNRQKFILSANIKEIIMSYLAELRIPDIWFDFYARFLPGAGFVVAIRTQILKDSSIPNAMEFIVLAFGGYFCALLVQPFGSRLAGLVEFGATVVMRVSRDCVSKIQSKIGRDKRESMILSKMHGEVTFFCQLAVLSIVVFVIALSKAILPSPWHIGIPFVLVILAFEVAIRRVQKARKYEG